MQRPFFKCLFIHKNINYDVQNGIIDLKSMSTLAEAKQTDFCPVFRLSHRPYSKPLAKLSHLITGIL